MKKYIFLLPLLCMLFLSEKLSAQRYLPGQKGLQITWGGVDECFSSPKGLGGNMYLGMAVTSYNTRHSRWFFAGEYMVKHYGYKMRKIPKAQFTAEAGYYVPFLRDRGHNVFFSLGASALAGYETSNWNRTLLYDGATLRNKGCLIYGFAPGVEMEAFLNDRLVFLLNLKERIYWGSSVGHFHTVFGIGLRYIIN